MAEPAERTGDAAGEAVERCIDDEDGRLIEAPVGAGVLRADSEADCNAETDIDELNERTDSAFELGREPDGCCCCWASKAALSESANWVSPEG